VGQVTRGYRVDFPPAGRPLTARRICFKATESRFASAATPTVSALGSLGSERSIAAGGGAMAGSAAAGVGAATGDADGVVGAIAPAEDDQA
jgi:hypothetical protein